jgi:hypothetical protein
MRFTDIIIFIIRESYHFEPEMEKFPARHGKGTRDGLKLLGGTWARACMPVETLCQDGTERKSLDFEFSDSPHSAIFNTYRTKK